VKYDINLNHPTPKSIDFEGKIIIFSAPSGAGKTTIVNHLLKTDHRFGFSISACTRPQRANEIHGKDYYFLTADDFKHKITQNDFIEWEEVYENAFYGTLKSEVYRLWSEGKHVLFDVDVKGGLTLKNHFQNKALAIFVKPPSVEILGQRLRERNTDSEESILKRIQKSEYELQFEDKFDKIVVNESLDIAFEKVEKLVADFLKG
jgi:guanylate kinase